MKLSKEYERYMRGGRRMELPGVGLKRLKKMLKRCRSSDLITTSHGVTAAAAASARCPGHCLVFDPVSLSCGHIFCYLCSCSAASVTFVDGLKSADHKSKYPLCRQAGVFPNVVHLEEMNMLIKYSCPEYWEKRMQMERVELVRLAKEHWESLDKNGTSNRCLLDLAFSELKVSCSLA